MATQTSEKRTNHASPGGAVDGRWLVSSERSRVGFRVKKMGLYRVRGVFRAVDGTVEFHPGSATADIVVDPRSVSTRMPPRDAHLRSGDFLDVKTHPVIAISADSVEVGPDGMVDVRASFEIRGQRANVELSGHYRAADDQLFLKLAGELDRHEFGIRPRQPFEMIVGRRVELDVELVLTPAA